MSGTNPAKKECTHMKSPLACSVGFAAVNLALISPVTIRSWEVDSTFNPSVAGGIVHSIAPLPEGGILVGGEFTSVSEQPIRRLARLDASGLVDRAFAPNPDGPVFAVAPAGGMIIVGGSFNVIAGTASGKVASLAANGALNPFFQVGPKPDNRADCLDVDANGRIVFGGPFRQVGSGPVSYLARWHADGSPDATFNSGLSPNLAMEAGVDALAIQPDGKVIVGGNFDTDSGFTCLARLNHDGTIDGTFSNDHGPMLYPKAILVLSNGQILVTGAADSYGRGFVRRLNQDGSIDTTFNEPALDRSVEAVTLDGEGKLLLGGEFSQVNGSPRERLALLAADGTLDESWTIGANGVVKAIAVEGGGNLLIGGAFTEVDGTVRRGMARIVRKGSFAFKPMSVAGGRCDLRLKAQAGRTYVIEASNDLSHWTVFKTEAATSGGLEVSDSGVSRMAQRFFRARLAN